MRSQPSLRFVPVLSLLAFAVGCQDAERPVAPSGSAPQFSVTEGPGSWTTKAPMPTARADLAAGVANGILYALGGQNGPALRVVEAYDPVVNSWTSKASMPTARFGLVTGVVNGVLYAVGGSDGGSVRATVEAYNPATNTWTTKASMPTARAYLAVGVVNGILYAVGGTVSGSGTNALATVEAYDPATNAWTTKASMPTGRSNLAVGVVNGVLYAVGGSDGFSILGTVQAYDPTTNTWTTKAPMPTPRWVLATDVVSGVLYAVGGVAGSVLATVEAYDPATNAWTTKASMPTARGSLGTGVVNGILYAVGGHNGNYLATVEAYQPATGGAGPNEPAGFTPYTDRYFNEMPEPGWGAQAQPDVPGGLEMMPIVVQDPSAPVSQPNVGQITYRAGFTGAGYAPGQTWTGGGLLELGWKQIYVRFAVKLSANWEGHASGVNKVGFIWMNNNNPVAYFSAQGVGDGPLRSQVRLTGMPLPVTELNLTQNLADPVFTRDQWHLWEVVLIANTGAQSNGEAHWWIDGVKVGQYTGLRYDDHVSNVWGNEISWFPVWGGENGTPVAQEMYMWMDHYYLSGKP
jgi:hypothetical protein